MTGLTLSHVAIAFLHFLETKCIQLVQGTLIKKDTLKREDLIVVLISVALTVE